MSFLPATLRLALFLGPALFGLALPGFAAAPIPGVSSAFVTRYCLACHDDSIHKADLSLEGLDPANPAAHADVWERVLKKLTHRQMPPVDEDRPPEADYNALIAHLATRLDASASTAPDPGRTDSLRRLNRTEYQNAIRDLLALDIDATALLPNDEPALGFDNVTVGNLSPTLVDRYVSAAQKIARLAVGTPRKVPGGDTFRLKPDLTQEGHVEGLPFGTRGGALFPYTFPLDGVYEIQVRLARDRNEQVEGLRQPHEIEILLDGERVGLATVRPPGADKNAEGVDAHLKFRIPVKAGPRSLGVTFIKNPTALIETERQPFLARFNMHRHPRTAPALFQTSITGPFEASGPGDTPSRRAIFGDNSDVRTDEARAREILTPLLRRAYRRPVTDADLARPLQFFREAQADFLAARSSSSLNFPSSTSRSLAQASLDAGIEGALAAILVSPQFLLRIESDPAGLAPGAAYRITDLELASRLAFFLWSSLPDDPLLAAATRGDLANPALLEAQVRRMLADPRAQNLVTNFAVQWLHLRGLESAAPDVRRFVDFDDNVRQGLRTETELFVASIFREDRPVTDLLAADYTFLNERLAKHYGIPFVYGSRFRRVSFAGEPDRQRGGLLRQGSILTVTSYATRTSPVIRGHWILANLAGEPTPPPPPDVTSLDAHVSEFLPMRERLAAHRANPVCASCHNLMDPVGFALENFDAVGRWRTAEDYRPVDAAGGFSDGSVFTGVAGLERALLARPELFAGTLTEKLMVFALGRGVRPADAPAVRAILRDAATDNYRFSSLILGIVKSPPFQMRRTAPAPTLASTP